MNANAVGYWIMNGVMFKVTNIIYFSLCCLKKIFKELHFSTMTTLWGNFIIQHELFFITMLII